MSNDLLVAWAKRHFAAYSTLYKYMVASLDNDASVSTADKKQIQKSMTEISVKFNRISAPILTRAGVAFTDPAVSTAPMTNKDRSRNRGIHKAMVAAASRGQVGTLRLLIEATPVALLDPIASFTAAMSHGHDDCALFILGMMSREQISNQSAWETSALHYACKGGCRKTAMALLGPPTVTIADDDTDPLFVPSDLVNLLEKRDGKEMGHCPMEYAHGFGHEDLLGELLDIVSNAGVKRREDIAEFESSEDEESEEDF